MVNLKGIGQKLVGARPEEMSLQEYLELAKKDNFVYATPAQRLLKAIGEPELIDTRKNERLSKIFSNEIIPVYKPFKNLYGLEVPLREVVSVIKHAAQGMEEEKQILYLKGPVGGGKSTIARILKRLMEVYPFYSIKDSPVYDNPLSLFSPEDSERLHIPERYLNTVPSSWLMKRIQELNGDISKLKVVKIYPNELKRVGIVHIEAGDENNQDITTLVGKLNINELGNFPQDDPDCYSYSGGLCVANRGLLEFTEMFKAPPKTLNPLYEATQSRFYNGTENIGALPFEGLIVAHSNEAEWNQFRNNQRNEALIDRICIINIPYCLRYTEETLIYKKLIDNSELNKAPCAPQTLTILSKFSVLTRLIKPSDGKLENKLEVYNGDNLKHTVPNIKNVFEYKQEAHENKDSGQEGFFGVSTRFAFKVLAQTYNMDTTEVAANPLHLLCALSEKIPQEDLPKDTEVLYLSVIQYLTKKYRQTLEEDIKKASIETYDQHGQNIADRYILYADSWLNEDDYRDPLSNMLLTPEDLDSWLVEIEVPLGVSNKKDFRNEIVKFALRYKSQAGKDLRWTAYQKLKEVIEAKIFSNFDEMLPIISTSSQASKSDQKKHQEFIDRMVSNGYTPKQTQILIDWYIKSATK